MPQTRSAMQAASPRSTICPPGPHASVTVPLPTGCLSTVVGSPMIWSRRCRRVARPQPARGGNRMILDLVLTALAITFQPLPLLAFILVLSADRGLRKGLAFLAAGRCP